VKLLDATRVFWVACLLLGVLGCQGSSDNAQTEQKQSRAAARNLSISDELLSQALKCTSNLDTAVHKPILLVPGTTLDPEANYSWNWLPALDQLGWPYCTVELPANTMGDIQEAAEYIVYAVRYMAATSNTKVQIVGHSQGGMVPRWAIRFWPDIRPMIDDLVSFSASNHGTIIAPAACLGGCSAAIWQQDANSNFMAALNDGFETVEGIDYTSIYTNLDEIVVPNVMLLGASSALAGGDNVTNVATQDVCPLNTADHLLVGMSDPVAYTLAMDALQHDGPADPSRVDAGVCTQLFMPGVNSVTFPTDFAATSVTLAETLASQERLQEEPPLKCYVTGDCVETK